MSLVKPFRSHFQDIEAIALRAACLPFSRDMLDNRHDVATRPFRSATGKLFHAGMVPVDRDSGVAALARVDLTPLRTLRALLRLVYN